MEKTNQAEHSHQKLIKSFSKRKRASSKWKTYSLTIFLDIRLSFPFTVLLSIFGETHYCAEMQCWMMKYGHWFGLMAVVFVGLYFLKK